MTRLTNHLAGLSHSLLEIDQSLNLLKLTVCVRA